MNSIDKIYMIGCGGVGFCALEIIVLEKLFENCKLTIIDPKTEIPDLKDTLKGRKYRYLSLPMTPDNYKSLLKDISPSTFVINVSVNVDSIMILNLCVEKGAFYIDTSLEMYEDHTDIPIEKIKKYKDFEKNNLYHQNLKAFEVGGKSKKTRLISSGANPALVNQFAKKALKLYAESKDHSFENWSGDYAKLGYEMELEEIQVVEYDTQKLRTKARRDRFVNTWSCIGFESEARDLCMLSLNNEDLSDMGEKYNLIAPTEKTRKKGTHVRFLNERGMSLTRDSITLDDKGEPRHYTGMLIPHAEIISLSEFFQYKGNAPSIMYVYRPCDEAVQSLKYFKDNNYVDLKTEVVVRGNEVESGYDSIGALLRFKNGDLFGGWTVCSIDDCRRLKIRSNPTTLQVIAYLIPAIKWALLNPRQSLNNAETVPSAFIFEHGEKYMGKIFFKSIDANLVDKSF